MKKFLAKISSNIFDDKSSDSVNGIWIGHIHKVGNLTFSR